MPVSGVNNNTNTNVTTYGNTPNSNNNTQGPNFNSTLDEAKKNEAEKDKKAAEENAKKKTPEEIKLDEERLRNNGLTDAEVRAGVKIDPLTGKKYIPKQETIEDMQARQEAMQKEMNKRKDPYSKDTFLQLLVAQMKHQDPLEPMSNEDMLAQMAQFSTVEQLTNLNQSFDKFAKGFSAEKPDGSTENLLLEQLKRLNDNMEKISSNFGFTESVDKDGNVTQTMGKFFESQHTQFVNLINRIDSLEAEIKKLAQIDKKI